MQHSQVHRGTAWSVRFQSQVPCVWMQERHDRTPVVLLEFGFSDWYVTRYQPAVPSSNPSTYMLVRWRRNIFCFCNGTRCGMKRSGIYTHTVQLAFILRWGYKNPSCEGRVFSRMKVSSHRCCCVGAVIFRNKRLCGTRAIMCVSQKPGNRPSELYHTRLAGHLTLHSSSGEGSWYIMIPGLVFQPMDQATQRLT